MNTQNIGLVRKGSIALIAFVLLALIVSPITTQASEMEVMGVWPDDSSSMGVWPDESSNNGSNGGGYSYPDEYGYGGASSYSDNYGYPSYSTGYGSYGYTTGYSNYSYPSYTTPHSNPSNSVSNTCTAPNTCNTNIDDHSIFNAPTVVTITTTESKSKKSSYKKNDCNDCGCRGNCYHPIAYNTPYVSLSAAPYTGLELGPVGTAIYWGFLILWCLIAAYLIVVKRVQNKIFRSLNSFLFGDNEVPAQVSFAGVPASYSAPVAAKQTTGDDFILNQIARVRTK